MFFLLSYASFVFFLYFCAMKLIADSGSTKTDWALVDDAGQTTYIHTEGISPIHQDETTISNILRSELLSPVSTNISPLNTRLTVYFYGSGVTAEHESAMERLLRNMLGATSVSVHSDLLGAARGLCGRNEGIACILGTGSNSCYYDGTDIRQHTPALGYVLGDEGSGAVLGRLFLNALYKGVLSESMRTDFEQQTGLNLPAIIHKVYRQPLANRFLASLSSFIHDHLDCKPLEALVIDNFRVFLQRNVVPYWRKDLPVSAVGSVAFHYREQLEQAARDEGFMVGTILQSPLEGLLKYHQE